LADHPEVEMAAPVFPEPKFFMDEGTETRRDEYLQRYFGNKAGVTVFGEKSTSYIDSEPAAERIARAFPDAKIIVSLRDPVQRAVSHYWFSVTNGREDRGIEVLLDEAAQRRSFANSSASPFVYLDRGRYIDSIDVYARLFPRDQIKLIVNEQFVGNKSAISELYDWLAVDSQFLPKSIAETINSNEYGSPSLPANVKSFLCEFYAEPNKILQDKYGVDISSWTGAITESRKG
jgi:hypothetical protein